MRILLIGGAGYLGRALSEELGGSGLEVIASARSGSSVDLDITDPSSIGRVLRLVDPDVVVNLAAAGVDASRREHEALREMIGVNAVGPAILIREMRRFSEEARLLHLASSREVLEGPVNEGRSTYAVTKSCGTALVAEAIEAELLGGAILRLHSVYGGAQPCSRFIASVISAALNGRGFKVREPSARLDFVHVEDVILAIRSAIEGDYRGSRILDIGTGVSIEVMRAAQSVYRVAGASPDDVSEDRAWRDVDAAYEIRCDIEPTYAALRWRPTIDFEHGIARAVEEFRCTGL